MVISLVYVCCLFKCCRNSSNNSLQCGYVMKVSSVTFQKPGIRVLNSILSSFKVSMQLSAMTSDNGDFTTAPGSCSIKIPFRKTSFKLKQSAAMCLTFSLLSVGANCFEWTFVAYAIKHN